MSDGTFERVGDVIECVGYCSREVALPGDPRGVRDGHFHELLRQGDRPCAAFHHRETD